MAAVLCIDFDDTFVTENTMRQLLERFAAPGWKDLEASYHSGAMTVEQFNAATLRSVEASHTEIEQFVAGVAEPRPGGMELLDWARWHGWHGVILSNGFDLYIDPVLRKLGVDNVVRHAGKAQVQYRWTGRFFSPRGIEIEDRFKVAYVQAFRSAGDFIAYVGDGKSDVEAATLANVVFARDTLLEALSDRHPRIYPFASLHDVREVLDREAESWLVSFSSTTAAADS